MHCPQCGQQQISDKARYCTRCGFLLSSAISMRRKELVQGTILITIGVVALPFLLGVLQGSTEKDFNQLISSERLMNIIESILVLWGLWRIISALRSVTTAKPERVATPLLPPKIARLSPSPSNTAVDVETSSVDTAKIPRASSITENTTELLDESSQTGKRNED